VKKKFTLKGMLSAAVCGSVFTSPAVKSIVQAIFTTSDPSGPGCLLIVKRYTGDLLNFGLAAEIAIQNGYKVKMVVVGDDVALLESNKNVGRRGKFSLVDREDSVEQFLSIK
jgi:triose/dihydroxyacetone kinase / FAD-AMP lyase (cyclizing)